MYAPRDLGFCRSLSSLIGAATSILVGMRLERRGLGSGSDDSSCLMVWAETLLDRRSCGVAVRSSRSGFVADRFSSLLVLAAAGICLETRVESRSSDSADR